MSKSLGWTEEMVRQLLNPAGKDHFGNFHMCVLMKASQHELNGDFGGFTYKVTFMGTLSASAESVLRKIKVGVKVETTLNAEEINLPQSKTNAPGTIAIDFFSYQGDFVPALIVCLRGEKTLAQTLDNLLQTAKVYGNEHVPLWLWYNLEDIEPQSPSEILDSGLSGRLFWIQRVELKQINDLSGPVEDVLDFEWPIVELF